MQVQHQLCFNAVNVCMYVLHACLQVTGVSDHALTKPEGGQTRYRQYMSIMATSRHTDQQAGMCTDADDS